MRVITFSRFFPTYHPRKGEETFFVEKILNGVAEKMPSGIVDLNLLKNEVKGIINDFVLLCSSDDIKSHTIRAGNRWKVGDYFSPRVWSGKPYASKQIEIAPPIEIKKIWTFEVKGKDYILEGNKDCDWIEIAKNDGLSDDDFEYWFMTGKGKPFKGQIICWNESIEY